jgi:hypothetical protein
VVSAWKFNFADHLINQHSSSNHSPKHQHTSCAARGCESRHVVEQPANRAHGLHPLTPRRARNNEPITSSHLQDHHQPVCKHLSKHTTRSRTTNFLFAQNHIRRSAHIRETCDEMPVSTTSAPQSEFPACSASLQRQCVHSIRETGRPKMERRGFLCFFGEAVRCSQAS